MIIAVDTGGTKTLIEAFDDAGVKQQVAKFPTPHDPALYLEQTAAAIRDFAHETPIRAICVALPGTIRNNILTRAGNLGWNNIDIDGALSQTFPDTPVWIGNDADLAGLAEARALDSLPSTSLYVTLSTGIGTGVCFDGQLFGGMSLFEGGAIRLQYDDVLQRWEDFASGKNFYDRYQVMGSEIPAGDERWQDYARRVAAGMRVLIPMFEPDALIIGGSMGTHYAKYADELNNLLARDLEPYFERLTISQAKHPEEAVIYGCYHHAVDLLADQ